VAAAKWRAISELLPVPSRWEIELPQIVFPDATGRGGVETGASLLLPHQHIGGWDVATGKTAPLPSQPHFGVTRRSNAESAWTVKVTGSSLRYTRTGPRTCMHYGARVPATGFLLIYLAPASYTDSTEGFVLASRPQSSARERLRCHSWHSLIFQSKSRVSRWNPWCLPLEGMRGQTPRTTLPSVMKPVAKFGVHLTRFVPVESSKGQAVVQLHAFVGQIQHGKGKAVFLLECLPHGNI
jgi:hypothetical protein